MRKILTRALSGIISASMIMQLIAFPSALAENNDVSLFSSVVEQAGNNTIKAKGKAFQRGTETAGVTSFDAATMPEVAAGGTTYYIDPEGNDSNDGTSIQTPWKTAERINTASLNAGDRILFKAGGTWTAPDNADGTYIADFDDDGDDRYDYWIIPSGNGTKEKPIVIGAYGEGALPKLTGASNTNSVLSIKDNEYWDISNLDISNCDETFDYSKPNDANNAAKMGDLRGIDIFGQSKEMNVDGKRIIRGFKLHDLYIHDITGYVYWGGAPADRGYPGVYGNMGQDASKRTGGIVFEVWKPTTETYLGFTDEQKISYDSLNAQLADYTGTAGAYVDALNMKQAAEDRSSYGTAEQTKYETARTAIMTENSELAGTIDATFASLQTLINSRKDVQDTNASDQPIIFDDVTIENNVIYDTSFGCITVKQWEGDGHKEVDVSPFYIEAVQKTYENWGRREGADAYWDNTTKTLTQEDEGWHPHTNIVIKNNYVSQEGMEQGCNTIRIASVKGALIEHNVCAGSGTCAIELDYIDDSVTQYNEIYGTYKKMGGADNNAIDTDYRTTNCLVQYNYVYNNGDSFLLCGKAFSTAVYRYNIAANTSAGNSRADDHFVSVDGDKGYNYIYNNLFYNNLNVSSLHYIVQNTATLTQNSPAVNADNPLYIYNNIFYNDCDATTVVDIQADERTNDVFYYDSNSYFGAGVTPPKKDAHAVTDIPYFEDGEVPFTGSTATTAVDLAPFAVKEKSPLINRGKTVELPESFRGEYVDKYKELKDMFGNSVGQSPDIGVNEYQLAENTGVMRGRVLDDYSNPVPGATVTATAKTKPEIVVSGADLSDSAVTVTVTSRFNENKTAVPILAVYDSAGKLISLAVKDSVTLVPNTINEITFTGIDLDGETNYNGKILFWDTLDGMEPLYDATELADTVVPEEWITAETDENGYYSFGAVPVGSYNLATSKTNYTQGTAENQTVTADDATEVSDITIESTASAGTITGKVTRADIGIEGLTVNASKQGQENVITTTDANGAYTIDAPYGEGYTLTVSGTVNGEEYSAQSKTDIVFQRGLTTEGVDFAVVKASEEAPSEYAVVDTFDDYSEGALSSDKWTKSSTGSVTVMKDDDNGYLRINKSSGTNPVYVYNTTAANLSGIVTIGARVSRASGGGSDQFSMFSLKENPSGAWSGKGNKVATFAMASRNVITHYLNGSGGSSTVNVGTYDIPASGIDWHKVWIVANLENKTFDFYYDDNTAPVLINQPLANTSASTVLNTFLMYSDASGAGHMNVDYFYACEGIQLDESKLPKSEYADGSGTISGTVTCAGVPVSGATVTAEGKTATTDANGAYTLTEVSAGRNNTVSVSADGYKSITREDIALAADGSVTQNFALRHTTVTAPTEYKVNEDFSRFTTGALSLASGADEVWKTSVSTNQSIAIVEDAQSTGGKYVHMESSNATGLLALHSANDLNITDDIITVESRIKRSSDSDTNNQFGMYSYNSSSELGAHKSSAAIATFYMSRPNIGTHVSGPTATNVMTYEKNTWYTVRLVINKTKGTFDFYADDMDDPKIVGGSLVNNKVINRFMFFATAKGDMDVDYFRVYSGEPYDAE